MQLRHFRLNADSPLSASLAGITALPTDPAVLLELGPLANSLASALPTSSVLAVLLTAAPSGFVSSVVNNPSYANSFESAFAAGNSPSWFNGLPTDVKSYLHTYSGFGGLATAASAIQAVTLSAASEVIAGGTATGIRPLEASGSSGTTGPSATSGSAAVSGTTAATGSSSGTSTMTTIDASASSESAYSASTLSAAAYSVTHVSTPSTSTTSSKAGAARPTGAIAAGLAGAVGLLGAAIAL